MIDPLDFTHNLKSCMYSCYNNLVKYALTMQFDIEVDVMYEVKLDAFNGPLDLLLHLIQNMKLIFMISL